MQAKLLGLGESSLLIQIQMLIFKHMVTDMLLSAKCLQSELAFAKTFGVLKGTVRKFLAALVYAKLFCFHRGFSMFISFHSDQGELFQFFHLVYKNDTSKSSQNRHLISNKRFKFSPQKNLCLKIYRTACVLNIRHIRIIGRFSVIIETIVAPNAPSNGLGQETRIINELYQVYEQAYGFNIHKKAKSMQARTTTHSETTYLPLHEGDSLVEIDRPATTLSGTPVKWRVSRYGTSAYSYLNELF